MSQNGTDGANLPMVLLAQTARPAFARNPNSADFISQLIAARDRLATQRARRRAPLDTAIGAYRAACEQAIVRLPSGSYRSRTV